MQKSLRVLFVLFIIVPIYSLSLKSNDNKIPEIKYEDRKLDGKTDQTNKIQSNTQNKNVMYHLKDQSQLLQLKVNELAKDIENLLQIQNDLLISNNKLQRSLGKSIYNCHLH